jgi:uridine phosphorylase
MNPSQINNMPPLHQKESFLELLRIKEKALPSCLILVGASDAESALKYLIHTLKPKRVKKTGLPNVYTGYVNEKFIAFEITYATSLTADIVHSFCAIGVKEVAFFGFCGAINSTLTRGSVISLSRVIDFVGIKEAYKQHRNIPTHSREYTVATWHNLYSETKEKIREWKKEGIDAVDLETAAVTSVCSSFRVKSFIRLIVAEQLSKNERLNEVYQSSFSTLKRKQQVLIKDYLKSLNQQAYSIPFV